MVQKYLAFFGASGESLGSLQRLPPYERCERKLSGTENPLNSNKFPLRFGYGADDVLANVAIKEAFGDGQYVYSGTRLVGRWKPIKIALKISQRETLHRVVSEL